MKTVLVFCAHPDDEVFGLGGTIAKYSEEGKRIVVCVFSYGEKSQPWMKEKFIKEARIKESEKAGKIIGCSKTVFFGLSEGKFEKEAKQRNLHAEIKKIILAENPEMIFVHSVDDPHPDHRNTFHTVWDVLHKLPKKYPLYTFDVWNPFKVKNRRHPRLIVDISSTFQKKISALKEFRSQKLSLLALLWSVYLRAVRNGIPNGFRYGEAFTKVQ